MSDPVAVSENWSIYITKIFFLFENLKKNETRKMSSYPLSECIVRLI